MSDNQAAIITFKVKKVALAKARVLQVFTEMDDGLDMSLEHKTISALALFERVVANEEIHLLAIEVDYILAELPNIVASVKSY
ncbi:MAG: hypothetical protein HRU28_18515 [Rhizobiales bacterium]|nr:hypothetical protein [Hyphomicrobiales bacterium]